MRRSRIWLPAALAGAVAALVLSVPAPASAAVVPDGHNCWWSPDTGPTMTVDNNHVNYSRGVICDGLVRRIDLTVEVLYYGQISFGVSGVVVGRTYVAYDVTSQWLGATTPGATCSFGYYGGRATATVQFWSGQPEFITRQTVPPPRLMSCNPPPLDL